MKKILILVAVTILSTGCGSVSIQDQIAASSEGRALERIADNLSNKASSGNCSIIKTGGFFYATSSVSVNCP